MRLAVPGNGEAMVQVVITSTRIPPSQSRARRPCHDGFVAWPSRPCQNLTDLRTWCPPE